MILSNPFLGGMNYARIQWVDWDMDGDIDLFILDQDRHIKYFQNMGTSLFPNLSSYNIIVYIYSGIAVGGLVLTPILAVIINNYGWRSGALFSGIMILIVCIPISYLIKDSPFLVKQNVDGKRLDDSDSTASRQRIDSIDEKGYSFRSAISTVNYWILAGAIALRISAQAGVMIHLVPILVWKNFEEELGGITVAIISASAIFTRVLMGWLGDKVEKRIIVSLSMLVGMFAILIFLFAPATIWTVIIFSLLISITDGAAGLTWAMIGDFFWN